MFLRYVYNILLFIILILLSFKLFKKKARESLRERLALQTPSLESDKAERIWIHAVSVGEAKAAIPLVQELRRHNPKAFIVFTTTTKTGLEVVKKGCPEADRAFLMPFDLFIRPLVRRMRPTLVLLSETDFWFNFLDEAKLLGAKIILINGKMSQKSLALYRFFPRLFTLVDRYIVQADIYRTRFLALGIPAEKIVISGNLKLDRELPSLDEEISEEPVLVIGSTHAPEEKLFLEVISSLWESVPELKVYLVPRHPERFEDVAKMIDARKIPFCRSSKGEPLEKLVLVDEMGKLDTLYQKATLAAVAGSWASHVGGHNILEPGFYGKPVIFGPYMHKQPEFLEMILTSEAGVQADETELKGAIEDLLQNPFQAKIIGKRGRDLVLQSRGALSFTFNELKPALVKVEDAS